MNYEEDYERIVKKARHIYNTTSSVNVKIQLELIFGDTLKETNYDKDSNYWPRNTHSIHRGCVRWNSCKYNYEEEDYIKDNYCGLKNYSWDYITSAQYIPKDTDQEVYDINFKDLI